MTGIILMENMIGSVVLNMVQNTNGRVRNASKKRVAQVDIRKDKRDNKW